MKTIDWTWDEEELEFDWSDELDKELEEHHKDLNMTKRELYNWLCKNGSKEYKNKYRF